MSSMRETITLNTQEQKRMMVLNRILAGQLSAAEAASLLKLSPRQMQRILAAYRKEGVAAVVHGNRDRKPKHTIGEEVRQQVIALARGPYAGCNQQHLRDLLAEREGIVLSRASVHRILAGAQLLPDPKRGKPVHRRRRQRYAQEGMLVQIDGSRHQWLEDRGPWLTLIAAIDDATGKISAAIFREQEDAQGYFLLVRQLVERYGCPLAFYHDRHSIFLQSRKATEADSLQEQLAGRQEPTQFARLLQELAITSIAARSRAGPKGAWSDSLAPYKIGWWSNCAWQEPAPLSKPMRSSRPICPASMPNLPSRLLSQCWRIVPCLSQ